MIKQLYYEWILLCANFIGCGNKKGFFDNNNLYEKKGWLDWKVKKLDLHSSVNAKEKVE